MTALKHKESSEEKAYQSIIKLIINQQYPPGTPLTETQVSEQVGMSRTPVRNALRRLIADGFLDSTFNKSPRVPNVSSDDLQALFDLRLMLEPKAAYLAAQNATADREKDFQNLIEKEREGYLQEDPDLYKINEKIHFGIAGLSGNVYLERAIRPIFWRSELYVFFFDNLYMGRLNRSRLKDPDKSISHKAHRELIRAIFENDPETAKEMMTAHILSTKKGLTANANYP